MTLRCNLLVLLLFVMCISDAQIKHENNFDRYSTTSGLSHNSITSVLQDSLGFVWISTLSGLNRFNGSNFLQYHSNGNDNGFIGEEMSGMNWLDDHRLVIYNVGLHIIDIRDHTEWNVLIPYHNANFRFKFNMIVRVLPDANGDMYVLTRSGFYHFNRNYQLVSRFDYYDEKRVQFEHFFFGKNLFWLNAEKLMIVGIDGIYIYDKRSHKIARMKSSDSPAFSTFLNYPAVYYNIFQPRFGEFLITGSAGDSLIFVNTIHNIRKAFKLNIENEKNIFQFRSNLFPGGDSVFYLTGHNAGFYKLIIAPEGKTLRFFPEKNFPSFLCTSLFTDRDHALWVGTNRGLFKENLHTKNVNTMMLSASMEDSFPNIKFDDISYAGGSVWAGTRGGGGLFRLRASDLQPTKHVLLQKKNEPMKSVNSLAALDKDRLLIGTNGFLYVYNTKTEMLSRLGAPGESETEWTQDIYKDKRGNVWISNSEHLYKYDPRSNSFALINNIPLITSPFKLAEDAEGNIWLASHGLARYNTRAGKFDIVLDSFPFIKMPDKQVNSIVADEKNRLWFNSNNNGLSCFDPSIKKFLHFTKEDGLSDNNIASMTVVDNKLWIACYSGLCCMDLADFKFMRFGTADGLPNMTINITSRFYYDSVANKLYLGFNTAVAAFRPADLLQKKSPPATFIESVEVNGNLIGTSNNTVTVSWRQNNLRIKIGTVNFYDGAAQQFAYRILNDDDDEWVQLGSESAFSVSGLSTGSHTIEMKIFSADARWAEQHITLHLVITPPVWKRAWFIITACVLFLILVFFIIQWSSRIATEKEKEKTKIEKLKADEYKNRLELEHISNYFSSSLADKRTKDQVLWDVAQNLIGKLNYEDCIIYMWDQTKTKMVQKAAFGPKGKPEHIVSQYFEVLPGQGIVGHVMKTRQPILVHDTRADKRYRVDDQFRLSEVCVPIIHNNELLGIIDSEHAEANYFSERDVNILSTIATLIANKLKQLESEQSLSSKRKELANINEQLAEARLTALQAQMNPHFVFNALNSIKRLILEDENEKASRYLSKFAQMIRMTLEHSKKVFISLEENIQYLKAYIQMEQLRFDDSFVYKIQFSDSIDAAETAVPSMMIQPLVENAVWHGLMQAKGAKELVINFTEADGKIVCTVEDNGIGINRSHELKKKQKELHNSTGIDNLTNRINIMNEKYDLNCSLKIEDVSEKDVTRSGTRVTLEMNLINVMS